MYLKNFPGYDNVKILGVEEVFDCEIDDWILTGVIDLIIEENGDLIVKDYKSKASFKNKKEKAEYARQLYLYSKHIKEKYGKFPTKLRFEMFRKQTPVDIPFNIYDYYEALNWARGQVEQIRKAWAYSPSPEPFFCNHLCNHRETCEFKCEEKH